MKYPLIRLILLIASAAFAWNMILSTWSVWKRRNVVDERKNELATIQEQNQRLKRQLEDIQSPQFIETEARNTLGLVKPGETLVILVTPIASESGKDIVQEKPNETGWGEWMKLFF